VSRRPSALAPARGCRASECVAWDAGLPVPAAGRRRRDAGTSLSQTRRHAVHTRLLAAACHTASIVVSLTRLLSASWGVEALRGKNTWADFWATAHPLHARGAGVGDGDGGRRRRCGLPAGVRSSRTCSWLFLLKHFSVQMSSKRIFYL